MSKVLVLDILAVVGTLIVTALIAGGGLWLTCRAWAREMGWRD